MTRVWREYVFLAGDLARNSSEAWQRSAVSRAYYGAFNPARRWVEANVGPIDDGAAHSQVWRAFKRSDRAKQGARETWRFIAELGDDLRHARNEADYADSVVDLDRRAPESVARAELILELLDELELVV